MKAKFSSIPTREVVITHGDESVTLVLKPLPLGYPELVDRAIPVPVKYLNGKPTVDEAAETDTRILRMWCLVARALGDQLEAAPPAESADSNAWRAYARAVREEFLAANFVEGDFVRLIEELSEINRGNGELGKGS